MLEIVAAVALVIVWLILGAGALWGTLVVFHLPRIATAVRIGLSALFPAALVGVLYWFDGSWTAAGIVAAIIACLAVGWTFYRAEHRIADATREPPMPRALRSGDLITVRNYGGFALEDGKAAFDYRERKFDLSRVESVWFGVQRFRGVEFLGHTYVAFEFDDGEVLGVSVQSKRPQGTPFSALRGMFKTYGLIYFLCDERHAVGYETLCNSAGYFLYRMRADRGQARRLLEGVFERVEQLAERPEFYHSALNNCTSNLVCEANKILERPLSIYSPRILLTGWSDAVAFDHGLIADGAPTLAETRARADVTRIACEARDDPDFSQRIRRFRDIGRGDDEDRAPSAQKNGDESAASSDTLGTPVA